MTDDHQRCELGEGQPHAGDAHPFVDGLANGVHESLEQVAQVLLCPFRVQRQVCALFCANLRPGCPQLHGFELYQVPDTMSVT
jgi:hypothetical protein